MKQTIKNYAFNASSKTVTFSDFSNISLDRIYLVTNVTSNTIIYQFNDNTLGGTVSTNVLTLTYNTGSMSNTDKLQIVYDTTLNDPDYDNVVPVSGTVTSKVQDGAGNAITSTSNALDVNIKSGGSSGVVTQGSTTSGESGNLVQGAVTTSAPTYTTGQTNPVSLNTSGALRVDGSGVTQPISGNIGSSSATGSAVPANAFYMGGIDGFTGVLRGFASQQGQGDANNANGFFPSANWTYNGSGWDRARSASTASGTTGTGLLGSGVLGQYNSSAPTISSGNYNVLQLDSSGNLKVNVSAGTGSSTQITDGTNTTNVLSSTGTAAGQNALFVANDNWSQTQNLTAVNQANTVTLYGSSAVSITLSNTFNATVQFEASVDGTVWDSVIGFNAANTSTSFTTNTGSFRFSLATYKQFRIRCSNYTSGTITCYILVSYGPTHWTSISGLADANGFQVVGNSPGDGQSTLGGLVTIPQPLVYDGSNWDRQRSASAASGTTGTGLVGAGALGLAQTSLPTAVSAGQYDQLMTDKFGRLVVLTNSIRNLQSSQRTVITSSTSETTIVTAGASGIFNDICSIKFANTSNTSTQIDIRDTTGGTIIDTFYLPPDDTRGSVYSVPWAQTTAAENWTATCGTSVASVIITVQYIKNQ